MSVKTVRLTIADAHSRHDLVVPADSTVAELLTVGGVDLDKYISTTTSGTAIELDSEVSETPGDGGVIWLFDRTATSVAPAAPTSRVAPRTPLARQRWVTLSLLVCIAVGMIAGAFLAPSPLTILVAAVPLLAGSAALLMQPVRDDNAYVAFFAPLLAAASGAVAISGFGDAGAMMATGMVAGATVACIRHALTSIRRSDTSNATAVIAALWSIFAIVNAAAFIGDVSATAITALQVAVAAPLFHYMRGSALDVDAGELIDTPFVIRDAPGLRARVPAEPSPIDPSSAARQYQLAKQRSDAGTVTASALALLSSLYAVLTVESGTIGAWCVLGGTLGVGCYFLLTSRKQRRGLAQGAALLTGALIVILATAALTASLQIAPLLIAVILIVAGVIVGSMTVPLAADWRSLGWSRTGDIIEAMLLAFSPAALIYGSGIAGEILEAFS